MEGAKDGKFYEHMKACNMLIKRLLALNPSRAIVSAEEHDVLGFCLEMYAYILLSNHVGPFGTLVGRRLELDTHLLSHDHMSQYRTFGTMFGDLYGLYQFVPQIARLASDRLDEEAAGCSGPSEASLLTYKSLEKNIASWAPTLPRIDTNVSDWQEQSMAAEIIRRGLYIYLLTSISGSLISDFETLEVLETYATTMFKYMMKLFESRYQTLFLWPALICGSCLTDPVLQRELLIGIKASYCRARHVDTACRALELLWEDPDPRAFGPFGLNRLKENGYWIPML